MSTDEGYTRPTNDIADKIIRGENVDIAEALKEEQKQRQRREADAVKLQLLCARIAKAIGKNVEQRTLLGAMAVMTAQAICYVHPLRHGRLYVDFLMALKAAIEGTYPKGQLLTPPDMSVLDQHIEVRTYEKKPVTFKEEPYAGESPPSWPSTLPQEEQEALANSLIEAELNDQPDGPTPAMAEAIQMHKELSDDLAPPAFLKRT